MKAKKPLALLLAIALVLGIGVPAVADDAPADDLPYVITPPKDLTIAYGRRCKISVEVYLPEDWTAEFDWNSNPGNPFSTIDGHGTSEVHYNGYIGTRDYTCDITATHKNGTVFALPQQRARITVKEGFAERLEEKLREYESIATAGFVAAVLYVLIGILTLTPVVYVERFFVWVRGLLPPVS